MAIARQTTASKVTPLKATEIISRRGTLGATVAAGELVTLQSDGKWDPMNTAAAQLTAGVAVQAGVDGDTVDIVRYGAVTSITGGTPGALVYGSDTAGEPSETAGTKTTIIGYVDSATVLFVQPQIVSLI